MPVFKDFLNTLRVLSTNCFRCIELHKIYEFLNFSAKPFLRIGLFEMQGNVSKVIAASNVSKNPALQQVCFCHILKTVPKAFQSLSKFFLSISVSHSVPFKFMNVIIHQTKDADFRPNSSW